MFDYEQTGGASDSWVARWREWRGIDRWPVVKARILKNEYIDTGEGGYHKLEVTYSFRASAFEEEALIVAWLDASSGSKPSVAKSGDEIDLLVNPERPDMPAFADTSNSAQNLVVAGLFIAIIAFVLLMKGCGA